MIKPSSVKVKHMLEVYEGTNLVYVPKMSKSNKNDINMLTHYMLSLFFMVLCNISGTFYEISLPVDEAKGRKETLKFMQSSSSGKRACICASP